mgnify:CR=1 FL=1
MHLWFLYYLIIVTIIVSGIARLMKRFSFLENIIVKIIKVPWKFVLVFGGLNVLWCILDYFGVFENVNINSQFGNSQIKTDLKLFTS